MIFLYPSQFQVTLYLALFMLSVLLGKPCMVSDDQFKFHTKMVPLFASVETPWCTAIQSIVLNRHGWSALLSVLSLWNGSGRIFLQSSSTTGFQVQILSYARGGLFQRTHGWLRLHVPLRRASDDCILHMIESLTTLTITRYFVHSWVWKSMDCGNWTYAGTQFSEATVIM